MANENTQNQNVDSQNIDSLNVQNQTEKELTVDGNVNTSAEPEILSKSKRKFFVIYAISTWIYRFFLFLGIAILVYYFAFKVLGIVLFLVEILWFILIPVYKELKIWWEKREKVSWNKRNKISLASFLVLLFVLFYPWQTSINIPAVIEADKTSLIYAPRTSYIKSINVQNGASVKANDVLMVIESQSLSLAISQAKNELENLQFDLKMIASNSKNLENRFIIEESIIEKQIELEGLEKIKDELTIKAPFDGKIYFKDTFKVNQNINPQEAIAHIYNSKTSNIIAFIEDYNLEYINKINKSKFIANNGLVESLEANILEVSKVSLTNIEYPELSSIYNGEIAVRQDMQDKQKLITEKAYFKIKAELKDNTYNFKTRVDGVLHLQSEGSSFVFRILQIGYNTIIKESGF